MATCSLDREGILTSGIRWSHAVKPICILFASQILNIHRLFCSKEKPFPKRNITAFSLFVLSYISLFCKVGRDYNSWLLSRSAFVISCDLSMREGVYLQRRIYVYFVKTLSSAMHLFDLSGKMPICFPSPVLFYLMSGEVLEISSNHFNKWVRSKLLQFTEQDSTCIKLQLRRKIVVLPESGAIKMAQPQRGLFWKINFDAGFKLTKNKIYIGFLMLWGS